MVGSISVAWVGLSLLVAHFFGDYCLQRINRKIFKRIGIEYSKDKNRWVLALHCLVYLFGFTLLFWWLEISFLWLLLLFWSHFLIDGWLPPDKIPTKSLCFSEEIRCLLKRDFSSFKPSLKKTMWLKIDQLLHYSILGIILLAVSL